MNRRILCLLFTAHLIALSPANSSADNFQPQLKALMDRYKQVEDQLARSVHYRKKEGTEPEITIQQAWYNGGGELLKVATERADAAGRELKEYVSIDDEDEPAKVAMFILTRRETRLPEGATRVEEERTCLGSSDLTGLVELRKLTRQAEFNAGQALDMERVPNVVHAPPKRSSRDSTEQATKRERAFLEAPSEIAWALRTAGALERDPGAENKADSAKYRVIRGTASPDGRYAIAMGFAQRQEVNWDDLKEEAADGVETSYSAIVGPTETPDVVNYLVDLETQQILGETGCEYFGTRESYNHRACTVIWSPDCKTFVQLTEEKWSYGACRAGRIAEGSKVVGPADIGKAAEDAAVAFLKARKREKGKGSIRIDLEDVSNDGVIRLQLESVEPVVPNRGDVYYTINQRLRLQSTSTGLSTRAIDVRYAPEDAE